MAQAGHACWIFILVRILRGVTGDGSVNYTHLQMSSEKHLLHHLLHRYDQVGKHGRPVMNISDMLNVYFGLGLIQLDLDEKNKILMLSMWTRMHWHDEYLMWNPADYDNITSVRLAPELIWIPDVTLYNTAEASDVTRDALTVISADGTVHWFPHSIFKSSCSVDVTNFPYDDQHCHLWFGSWTHSVHEMDLQMGFPGGIDLSTFQSDHKESCAWTIVNVTGQRKELPTGNESTNYAVLTFDISMKRKLVFSSYILTLPCVFLACLTLVVFWLPPDRPDRTALAMSTFASFMVLLLILVEASPPTASSIPTLGLYYCFNMVLIMFAIILSSLIVNISRGTKHQVPKGIMMVISSRLGTILCAKYFYKEITQGNHKQEIQQRIQSRISYARTAISQARATYRHVSQCSDVDKYINQAEHTLKRIEANMTTSTFSTNEGHNEQWKHLGIFLDRIFFCAYIGLIIISLSVLFPRPQ